MFPSLRNYGGIAPYPIQEQQLNFLVACENTQTAEVVPNCEVQIIHTVVPNSGGHDHDDPSRPKGEFSMLAGNTGPGGFLSITYTAPELSSNVNVNVSGLANGLPATPEVFAIEVGLGGLVELSPSDQYELIGSFGEPGVGSRHVRNHFGMPEFNFALSRLADLYVAAYPGERLRYNDMSLETGGVFDIGNNWQPPHGEHRFGVNVDLDTAFVNPEQRRELPRLMRLAGLRGPLDEGDHWHLTLRGF
ncbi:MAG TPA: hypothetical protein VNK82_09380 [Terriglobales bacterium]|nr:hypothetical protein [Terriglobales bacterium]